MPNPADTLRAIKTFDDLLPYLQDELDWPLEEYGFEDLTFEYSPAELGLREEQAAKVKAIYQLRPLRRDQPWGIFFVEFDNQRMPVVVLRRILSHLVIKKRAAANRAQAAAWNLGDLLFISAFGSEATDQREIAFAHFQQGAGDLPTLRVLGWDGADTGLKLDYVAATLQQRLCWPADPEDGAVWRQQWSKAFRHGIGHQIKTADELAQRLAGLARATRYAASTLMAHEAEHGPLRRLHSAFQTALIHDLSEDDFADTYAQTVTYGLLTAAIQRTDLRGGAQDTTLYSDMLAEVAPVTNPFLKEMLQTFLQAGGRQGGIDFDELGIQDVVELLRGEETDLPAILRDFGNKTRGEDPVIHFYEHFLASYDKQIKVRRGVFNTPQPVVSYIVRSVHELLQTEFGIEDGLASTVTWGEMAGRLPGLAIPEGTDPASPFVVILDPATGTATFPVEVIDVIFKTMESKWKRQGLSEAQRQAAWNEYVPQHLLPRLYGYELMMAPYAIAHMKIGLKLHETGYRFRSPERVRVFLTNALEPASDDGGQLAFVGWTPALAHEAQAVNAVKRHQRYTVVVGNPPYSKLSGNLSDNAAALIEPFRYVEGERVTERGALALELNLQDDYVKFWGLLCKLLLESGAGVASFITNSRYLASRSLRGLRWNMKSLFSLGTFLDLGGQVSERASDNSIDDNVFEIEQGVAIGVLARHPNRMPMNGILFARVTGSRAQKHQFLQTSSSAEVQNTILLKPPFYQFLRSSESIDDEFNSWPSLDAFMPFNSGSIITSRDNLAIDFDRHRLLEKIDRFASSAPGDRSIEDEIGYSVKSKWDVEACKASIRSTADRAQTVRRILYRPFDWRWIYYSTDLLDTPSKPVCSAVFDRENLVLLTPGVKTSDHFCHVLIADVPAEKKSCSHDRATQMFPLFQAQHDLLNGPTPNLQPVTRAEHLKAVDSVQKAHAVLSYIYAVLHSPTYRQRYGRPLRDSYPRIPFTTNTQLHNSLENYGDELIQLHLLKSPALQRRMTVYDGPEWPRVEKVSYGDEFVYLDKACTYGFDGMPEAVWNFRIGGYQVCEKWLKDRGPKKGQPGRLLSPEDIDHYQRIVVALHETIRIMGEIDEAIDEHGGWPIE